MTRTGLVLMLYFFIVAHKAACQTLSKAFLNTEVYEDMVEVLLMLKIFLTKDSKVESVLWYSCPFFSNDLRLQLLQTTYTTSDLHTIIIRS